MADYEASGQTVAIWCTDQKIKLCNFQYWRHKLRTLSTQPAEQPIKWLSLGFDIQPTEPGEGIIVQIGPAGLPSGKDLTGKPFGISSWSCNSCDRGIIR